MNDDYGDYDDFPKPELVPSAYLQHDLDAANLSLAAMNVEHNLNMRVDDLSLRFIAKQVALDESSEREALVLFLETNRKRNSSN